MTKPKDNNKISGRDLFQTPNYAVDLLVPYIPKNVDWIWEPACGEGKIVQRLEEQFEYGVIASDIRQAGYSEFVEDFLSERGFIIGKELKQEYNLGIITNPPFSLKYKFILRAIELQVPFAFLIPFDMCGKMADLFMNYEVQGLVPTRRIDYITPTGKSGKTGHTSYFHSFWLTRYFNLPDQLTFVKLSLRDKENI